MMPTPASANSPTSYTILDVDQNAYLFVGGIFGKVKVSVLLSTKCLARYTLFFLLFLSFRKQMWLAPQHLRAVWGRPSWMANLSDCGTTERDKETVKDVSSGTAGCDSFSSACLLSLTQLAFSCFQPPKLRW